MDSPRILLTLGLALTFWILARGLRKTHRLPAAGEPGRAAAAADVSAAACAFLAAVFFLKALPLLGPVTGLLRRDFLFPLWALWRRGDGWWWLLPALIPGLALTAVLCRGRRLRLHPVPGILILMGVAGGIWFSLSLTNGGWPVGVLEPLIRSADYYIDVDRFASLPHLWRDYVAQQPDLSVHGRTHPPGALTVLVILDRMWDGYVPGVAVSILALATLGLIPVALWARRFLPRPEATAVAILWVLTPAVALYGATSLDMIFALPLLAAGALFARAVAGRGRLAPAAGAGFFLAIGFLFTFSAAVLAMTFVLGTLLRPAPRRREGLPPLAVAGTICVVVLALVPLLTGFNPLACLQTALVLDGAEAPAFLSLRYYLLTRLMGILDFLVLSGIALAPLWLAVILRGWHPATDPSRAVAASGHDEPEADLAGVKTTVASDPLDDATLLALARGAALAVALFLALGAYKIGETGRIFLFLLPFVLIPVVRFVSLRYRNSQALGWALGVIALWQLGQSLLMEWFLDTRW